MTMTDLATLQTRLTEAETALHQLHMGSKIEEVQTSFGDGARAVTRFTPASARQLEAYVSRLRHKIARLGGGGSPRGPIYGEW